MYIMQLISRLNHIIMRFYLLVFSFIIILFSCKTQEIKNTNITTDSLQSEGIKKVLGYEMRMKGIDFYASGTELDWSLEIDFNQMVRFKSKDFEQDIVFATRKLVEVKEMQQVNYESKGGNTNLKIHIKLNANPFIYDDNNKPYAVQVEVKKSSDADWQVYNGQGEYYGNLILHDIWRLSELNGKSVSEYQIKEIPYIEIHLDNNRMNGFLGCNNFAGQIYFERERVFTGHIMSTKKACFNLNIEDDFAKTLTNSSFTYKVEKGTLTLWNDQNKMIFKKWD